MANLRDIRNRIESMQNTQQITKAMKMVAAAKLRKAQNLIIDARPYAFKMKEVVSRLVKNTEDNHILLRKPAYVKKVLFIVISSDRGLCGGFNNNLFKVVETRIKEDFEEHYENESLSLICLGRKATKHFSKRNYQIHASHPGFFEDLFFSNASDLMKTVIQQFKEKKFDAVYIAYNEFKSIISQNRMIEPVLPIDTASFDNDKEEASEEHLEYIYEPDMDSILEKLLPLHLNMQLWRAVLESNAAEWGARMTAMDSATENAKDLERDLRLEYNQARQSAITTEISEIVSGAQALKDA